ncbi:aldolase/citrate lyase family protein, partial [Cronobacter muytjensii]|uniref:aldolase/citrate lyase family protein n=1 Tax=Cronobacter muytjensii TaxID=413501 RepID=UPI0034D68374
MSKLRRSMLFLPGANAAMLSTAFIYRPDSIMFDLEDAVALREKDTAPLSSIITSPSSTSRAASVS